MKNNIGILEFISEKDKNDLIALGTRLHLRDGGFIFMQGEPGESLYAIDKGSVSIYTMSTAGKEVILQRLSAGDIFGEIALFDREGRTTSAVAGKGTVLVSVSRDKVIGFFDRRPHLYQGMIQLLCKRLRWSSKMVESFVFSGSMERLLAKLLYLAECDGGKKNVHIEISQNALAKMLGLSREIINRKLQELQKKKILTLARGRITIVNVDRLTQLTAPKDR